MKGRTCHTRNKNHWAINSRWPGAFRGSLYAIALVLTTCVTVFTRRRFGAEALGWNGLGAFLLLLFYAGSSPGMQVYFCLWVLALLIQRCQTIWMGIRGHVEHSRYGGWPWLAIRFAKNEMQAKALEVLLCLIAGGLLYSLSEAVGMFVIRCGFGMAVVQVIDRQVLAMQDRRMRDAEIEMRLSRGSVPRQAEWLLHGVV